MTNTDSENSSFPSPSAEETANSVCAENTLSVTSVMDEDVMSGDVIFQLAQLWVKWDEQEIAKAKAKEKDENYEILPGSVNEETLCDLVKTEQFKLLSEEIKCCLATVAAWRNHDDVVDAIQETLVNPDMFIIQVADSLPSTVPDDSAFKKWLDGKECHVSNLKGWRQGQLNHPLERTYTKKLEKSIGLVADVTDETIQNLCAHTDGYSLMEQYILTHHVDFKVYSHYFVAGVLLRACSLNHEDWQLRKHPLHPQHTIYDVLAGLLELEDCEEISVWVKKFSSNPLLSINQRSIVDYQIEILRTGFIKDLPADCKPNSARHDFLQWCEQNGYGGVWMDQYCKVDDNTPLNHMNSDQETRYQHQIRTLIKKAKEHSELFNDPQYVTALNHSHPLLDLYVSDHVPSKDFCDLISSQINWNMFEDKISCDVMLKNGDARVALVKSLHHAPPVGSDAMIENLLKYWCYEMSEYTPHFQAVSWNLFWKCSDRTTSGALTCGEIAVCQAIEKMTVFEKWSALCGNIEIGKSYLKNEDNLQIVRKKMEQWKGYIPQTWDDFIALKPRVEEVFKELKTWPTETVSGEVCRVLFTEENRVKSVADLEQGGKNSDVIKSWGDFFQKNTRGHRRSARAKDAVKGIGLLRESFPHFEKIVEMIENDLALAMMGRGDFFLPPLLMDGPPGTGKTFFFNELARVAKNDFHIFNMESVTAGPTFTGLDRMWGNTAPGELFEKMIKQDAVVNPIILLDELDKVSKSDEYPVAPVLLSLLEPHSAKKFIDRSVQLPLDVSRISWVATSNFIEKIDIPVRSRFRVATVPAPNFSARMKMSRIIETFLRSENPWGSAFSPIPDETLQVVCTPEGSARDLRKNLTHAFAAAARQRRSVVIPEDLPPAEKQPHIDPWDIKYEEIPSYVFPVPYALENRP